MKIEKLRIAKYRGFKEELEIAMHSDVNVFVGLNGSGKTSILDAVAALLQVYINIILEEDSNKNKNLITEADIYGKEKIAGLFMSLPNGMQWFLEKNRYNLGIPVTTKINSVDKDSIRQFDEEFYTNEYVPILVYYRTNRLFVDETIRDFSSEETYRHPVFSSEKTYRHPVLKCYENTLNSKINSFGNFEAWYIEKENKENRVRLREDNAYRSPDLEPVRKAITQFFEKIQEELSSGKLYVEDFEPGQDRPKLFFKKGNLNIRLDKLSDGEKTTILLVSDIARRLTMAHAFPEQHDPLKGKGIVLIDEIELHLHPSWQRQIIPALTAVFPNIQFIITTHSPQVLSNLKRENIHVIEDFQLVKNIAPIYGEDSNSILWEVFGVKKQPEHAALAFDKFYRSMEEGKEKALEALQELEATYGADHNEVKKARQDFDFEFGVYKE